MSALGAVLLVAGPAGLLGLAILGWRHVARAVESWRTGAADFEWPDRAPDDAAEYSQWFDSVRGGGWHRG